MDNELIPGELYFLKAPRPAWETVPPNKMNNTGFGIAVLDTKYFVFVQKQKMYDHYRYWFLCKNKMVFFTKKEIFDIVEI